MLRRELPPACRCPVFLKSVSICQSVRLSGRSSCWPNAVLRANGKDKSASCHSDDQSTQLKRSAALPTAVRAFSLRMERTSDLYRPSAGELADNRLGTVSLGWDG